MPGGRDGDTTRTGWTTGLATMLGVAGVARLVNLTTPRFGGENPLGSAPDPDNWHHEGITKAAAAAAGWEPEAANALAFHADYLDSYLYNPLWWFDVTNGGGLGRMKVVMATRHELVKLHFDDLFSPEQVHATWHRYLSGTIAGLLWIADSPHPRRLRVSMAHNLVGASLHAIQDFFSHSNWIDDPDRRARTWFDVHEHERNDLSLWTGTYEEPDHLGIAHHGDFLFACTVINNLGGFARGLLRLACHAASPLAGSSMCQALRACDDAEPIDVPEKWRRVVPEFLRDQLVWVKPGINVDSRWLADIGAETRDVDGLDGELAFATAYRLAVRASCQWLRALAGIMERGGAHQLWRDMTTIGVDDAHYKDDQAPWESMALLPWQFLSAGPYPPPRDHDDTAAWYLRLTITTADVGHAGTDADIVPTVDGSQQAMLDHAKPAEPPEPGEPPETSVVDSVLSHDDFERGETAAYIIGPLDRRPDELRLHNDAPDVGDVLLAAAEAVLDAVVGVLEGIRDFFLGLVGYHADFVDSDHDVADAATLAGLPVGSSHDFELDCDGGSEGHFRLDASITKTAVTGEDDGVAWREYLVHFSRLRCVEESDWDRFTNSDEPFVLGLVIPHGGVDTMKAWRTGPYSDVDSGDTRTINQYWQVRVPEGFGMVSVAVAVYESDSESSADRDDLLDEFADRVENAHAPAEDGFLVTLGESLASGWRPAHIDAYAYRRGADEVEVAWYEPLAVDGWVEGGEDLDWDMEVTRAETLRFTVDESSDCPDPPSLRLPDLVDIDWELPATIDLVTRPTFDVNIVGRVDRDDDQPGGGKPSKPGNGKPGGGKPPRPGGGKPGRDKSKKPGDGRPSKPGRGKPSRPDKPRVPRPGPEPGGRMPDVGRHPPGTAGRVEPGPPGATGRRFDGLIRTLQERADDESQTAG